MKIGVGIGLSYPKYTTFVNRGGQTPPFHPSLVDYWNFKGKSNFDKDRNTINGIKGEILTAYNFGWSLGSGYGLYGTDFRTQWNDTDASYGKIINSTIAHTDKVGSVLYVIAYSTLIVFADNFKGRITGMPEGYSLYIGYATNLYLVSSTNGEWSINKADIPYFVPEGSPESDARYNGGFKIMKTGQLGGGAEVPADVTIELIPEYQGAIVTDGVDDYLKLDKVGYKVGTVIIKYIPIPTVNRWQYVLDTQTERIFIGYTSKTSVENDKVVSSFTNIKDIGGYKVFKEGGIKNVSTPLFIGSNTNISEPLSMALYSIAIYDRVLSDQEVQEVINFMNKENES